MKFILIAMLVLSVTASAQSIHGRHRRVFTAAPPPPVTARQPTIIGKQVVLLVPGKPILLK